MKLKCLFFQRDETYEGQHAPELLCAVDEYTDDDNPEWFVNEQKEHEAWMVGKGVVRVIEIEVDQDSIRRMLTKQPKIDGTICDS